MSYRTLLAGTAAALCLGATASQAAFIGVVGANSIDGSLCVGFDCVANEAFGFDTIRLKENNLRIHFDDTSVAAAFPPNDWRIYANDSANGGSSYFGVEDATAGRFVFRVFAGARSNALTVDSQGDVGLGTTTPALDIDIKTGDTPSVRVQQDGTSGFTPQTWDMAGNEVGFFIRDATSGSTLPFRILVGAPSQALLVDGDGNVGIGAGTSPDADLHIQRTDSEGGAKIRLENTNTAGTAPLGNGEWELLTRGDGEFAINDANAGAPGAEFILRGPNATTPGLTLAGALTAGTDVIAGDELICNGAPGACLLQTSDIRLKPNAVTLKAAADIVRDLRPIRWDDADGTTSTGFAAQEVAAVMQAHGIEAWTGHAYRAEEDTHLLSYTALIALLVGAHQEKDARIAALEAAVQELRGTID